MFVLQIEHGVPDYEVWKQAFDKDPIGRKQGGVRRYTVARSVDNAEFIVIELEFDSLAEAEAHQSKLRELWAAPGMRVALGPRTRIVEVLDSQAC